MEISKDISIEDLVEVKPKAVSYLSEKGIKCIACGEPIWGTLGEAVSEKGFSEKELAQFIRELKLL